MLILTRHVGEMICIGPDITVTVVAVNGAQIKLGIAAPSDVRVDREEVRQRRDADISHSSPRERNIRC